MNSGPWLTAPLEQVAELSGGYAFKSEEYSDAGRFVLRTLNIGDNGRISREQAVYIPLSACGPYARFELRERDILFVMVGATLGKIGVVTKYDLPALLNQNMWRIRAITGAIDERFLFYAFSHRAAAGLAGASGSARSFVRRDDYRRLIIPCPPIKNQQAIASVLGALDDKIDISRRMNETLEAMVRAIFKDWFIDFGPTRAKMDGRSPYLAPDIWKLFPDKWDHEERPAGWSLSTIGEEVSVVGGSTPSTKEPIYWDGHIYWTTPKDLSALSSPVLLTSERQITEEGLAQISSGLLPIGTVLLSSRAPIGYLAIAQIPTAINQGFIGMICNRRLTNVFVWLWAKENHDLIVQHANGSTFLEISKSNFRPLPVMLPPDPVLQAFNSLALPLFDRIVTNEKENTTLIATRNLLLPKLMSGEIRMKDAEKIVEAVT